MFLFFIILPISPVSVSITLTNNTISSSDNSIIDKITYWNMSIFDVGYDLAIDSYNNIYILGVVTLNQTTYHNFTSDSHFCYIDERVEDSHQSLYYSQSHYWQLYFCLKFITFQKPLMLLMICVVH